MEMSGEVRIAKPREQVWLALNDPEILRQSIPGCDSVTKTSATEMDAVATVALGPVKAKFKGRVVLSDLNPPQSYTLSGEGTGGVAGFAKGQARVQLFDEGANTRLTYAVDATIGGKLAQLGQRLIDGAAKKMADDFFARFSDLAGGAVAADQPVAHDNTRQDGHQSHHGPDITVWNPPLWLPLAIAVLSALVIILTWIR